MKAKFVWQDDFNIGVESIDKEHQQLFRVINRLIDFTEEGKNDKWACQEGIKFFQTHALKHFSNEEAYMHSIGYSGLEAHRRIHRNFREQTLPALEKELEDTDYAPNAVEHFLGVCAGWLVGHTLTEDQAIAGKQLHRWENLLPGEEQDAIRKVVVQLLFDMFHLESQQISNSYGGEKFGKGIYYHLLYASPDGKNSHEFLLVFEDNLLINTVGKVLGIETNKLDDMLIHVTRYTARQFVERLMEHFPSMDGCPLKEEELLFYDQFQAVFRSQKIQASLLFDTGSGYFALCYISPHMDDTQAGTLLNHENAMTEVEEYLSRKETEDEIAEKKKKILLVDDSVTIREGIRRLLEETYEIFTAESGVAAIRAVTLDRPDLVLLDYEMPICDGRQTLEMLRSVKEFEELPVIFLTSRRDPDSMIKVMPLKPAGYLIKSAKPEAIKKEVDAFFAKREKKQS